MGFLENPIGQIFGIIAMIIAVIGVTQKDDKSVLKFIMLSYIFWFLHFIIMGVTSGAAATFMGLIRIFLSLKYKRNKRIFAGVLSMTIILGIITYENHISLLPIIGACISVYGYFFFEKVRLRLFMAITSLFWFTYNINIGSIGGIINEIIIQSILIITMYKMIHAEGKRVYFVDKVMDIVLHKTERKKDIGRFISIYDYIKLFKEKTKDKLKKILLIKIKPPRVNFNIFKKNKNSGKFFDLKKKL